MVRYWHASRLMCNNCNTQNWHKQKCQPLINCPFKKDAKYPNDCYFSLSLMEPYNGESDGTDLLWAPLNYKIRIRAWATERIDTWFWCLWLFFFFFFFLNLKNYNFWHFPFYINYLVFGKQQWPQKHFWMRSIHL